MLHLTKYKNGLQPHNTVADLQHNQIKSIISSYIISLSSNRAKLLLYFRKLVHFCSPTHTNYFELYSVNAFCTFQSLTPYLTMKKCVKLQSCWVCWTKVLLYSIVTSKREGQGESPQWSCHKILLILCTVSHLLLLKKKQTTVAIYL